MKNTTSPHHPSSPKAKPNPPSVLLRVQSLTQCQEAVPEVSSSLLQNKANRKSSLSKVTGFYLFQASDIYDSDIIRSVSRVLRLQLFGNELISATTWLGITESDASVMLRSEEAQPCPTRGILSPRDGLCGRPPTDPVT